MPASKRYAESGEDYGEILQRHNTLLDDQVGIGQPFVLVVTGHSDTAVPTLSDVWLADQYPQAQPCLTVPTDEPSGVAPGYWHFFMINLWWEPRTADILFRRVADDALRHVLFVSVLHGSVYAPYDGGADLILPSVVTRDELHNRFSAWLSTHPLGL